MKKLLSAAILILTAISTFAASVILSWDANPVDQEVTGYKVYQATAVTGPFTLITNTPITSVVLTLTPGKYFWYVTATNFWGESLPSETVHTPANVSGIVTLKVTK